MKNYRSIKVFILMILFTFLSCDKEEGTYIDADQEDYSLSKYSYNKISFEVFKNILDRYNVFQDFDNTLRKDFSKNGSEDFIIHIDTTRIIEFSNDSLTTYTLGAVTFDQDHTSFTNIVYIEKDNELNYHLIKYTPSEEWITSLLSGNKSHLKVL